MTWKELVNSGEIDGYVPFIGNEIDARIVDDNPCECGGKMFYRAMHDRNGSYRAFAVCTRCHEVQEF